MFTLSIPLPVLPLAGDYVMVGARLQPIFPCNTAFSVGVGGVMYINVVLDDESIAQKVVDAVHTIVSQLINTP